MPRKAVSRAVRSGAFGSASSAYNALRTVQQAGRMTRAVASAIQNYGTATQIQSQRRGDQTLMTGQHDSAQLYKKTRMPRNKRKRWTSFRKKVAWIQEETQPKCHMTKTNVSAPDCAAEKQAVDYALMYTGFNTGESRLSDILQCMKAAKQSSTTKDIETTNYHFTSALLEATLNNQNSYSVYVDVYWVQSQRKTTLTPYEAFDQGLRDNSSGLGETAPTSVYVNSQPNTLGITPFQSTEFCRNFKILRKTRIYLPPGASSQLQWRDPKNHYISGDKENVDKSYIALPNLTKGWFFVAYGVPYLADDVTPTTSAPISAGKLLITRYVNYTFNQNDVGSNKYAVTTTTST